MSRHHVGGNNILPMKDLVALLEGLGCTHVKTYIQSGNAVFSTDREPKDDLAEAISAAIHQNHGFQPRVLLLSAAELKNALTTPLKPLTAIQTRNSSWSKPSTLTPIEG
jgi:uncharacterized protein (DUF1697 family)